MKIVKGDALVNLMLLFRNVLTCDINNIHSPTHDIEFFNFSPINTYWKKGKRQSYDVMLRWDFCDVISSMYGTNGNLACGEKLPQQVSVAISFVYCKTFTFMEVLMQNREKSQMGRMSNGELWLQRAVMRDRTSVDRPGFFLKGCTGPETVCWQL